MLLKIFHGYVVKKTTPNIHETALIIFIEMWQMQCSVKLVQVIIIRLCLHNDGLRFCSTNAASYINIQASRVSRFRFLGNALWDMRSRKVSTNSRVSAITEYLFQLRVCLPFILSYFSIFNSSTTNPNQLHTSKVSSDGFQIIFREKNNI